MILPRTTKISKGYEYDKLGYSAFEDMELARKLEENKIKRLLVGGIATDYCVKSTVLDARRLGLEVIVLQDAVRGIKNSDTGNK